jgi:hypothetical protein
MKDERMKMEPKQDEFVRLHWSGKWSSLNSLQWSQAQCTSPMMMFRSMNESYDDLEININKIISDTWREDLEQ